MKIEKKVWPVYFEKLLTGEKTFEIRLANWECNAGDILVLKEYDPTTKKYTGREIERKITLVIKTKDIEKLEMFSQKEIDKYGYQIIAIKPP